MESPIEEEEKMALIPKWKEPGRGGLKAIPFIIVNETFEKIASFGLLPNMINYLMNGYHLKAATGSSIIFLWSACSNSSAIFGAFLADSYLGRFWVITLGSFSSLLGTALLWLTAMVPQLKPAPCDKFNQACDSATPAQLALLFSSFAFMSIGSGCIRPCAMAFGADQLENKRNPNNESILQSFFNWYYVATAASTVLAFSVILYIQDTFGWKIGLAVPVILMVCSASTFLLGSSLYIKMKPNESLFTGLVRVLVASCRKRNIGLQVNKIDQYYHGGESELLVPTNNLRCLNKACVIRDPDTDLRPDGSASNPWDLCTVEQVESVKALLRVIPMWSTGIAMMMYPGSPYAVLQAQSMDRRITSNSEIPAGSVNSIFNVITLMLWLAIYDRILVPILARHTGQPRGLSPKVRLGIGLLLSSLAMGTSAVIESIRRGVAIEEGFEDEPEATIGMSVFWLVLPAGLLGLAEGFFGVGQMEFFYSQLPKSMSSIALALFLLVMAAGNLAASLVVDVVNSLTSGGGKVSWLSSNINKGRLDYYYLLLAGLGMINFFYFILCCRAYGSLGILND